MEGLGKWMWGKAAKGGQAAQDLDVFQLLVQLFTAECAGLLVESGSGCQQPRRRVHRAAERALGTALV